MILDTLPPSDKMFGYLITVARRIQARENMVVLTAEIDDEDGGCKFFVLGQDRVVVNGQGWWAFAEVVEGTANMRVFGKEDVALDWLKRRTDR